jgi:hypothetical protein
MTNNFRKHYRTKDSKVLELMHGSNNCYYFIVAKESNYSATALKSDPFLKVTALELIREIFTNEKLFKIKTTNDFYTLAIVIEKFGEASEQFDKVSIINLVELLKTNQDFTVEYEYDIKQSINSYLKTRLFTKKTLNENKNH